MKFFILGGGNGFSGYWKPFWFAQSFSSVENVTEINGSQFLKKDHILTNENWFMGLWNPFSSFFFDIRQLLPVEANFHLTRTYLKCGNEVFIFFVYCFSPSFFLQVETIIEIREKSILKDEPYSC